MSIKDLLKLGFSLAKATEIYEMIENSSKLGLGLSGWEINHLEEPALVLEFYDRTGGKIKVQCKKTENTEDTFDYEVELKSTQGQFDIGAYEDVFTEPKTKPKYISAFNRIVHAANIEQHPFLQAESKPKQKAKTPEEKLMNDFNTYRRQCRALNVTPVSLESFKRTQAKQQKKGLAKYKTSLRGAKLTVPELQQHLLEELVDAINYANELKRTENM